MAKHPQNLQSYLLLYIHRLFIFRHNRRYGWRWMVGYSCGCHGNRWCCFVVGCYEGRWGGNNSRYYQVIIIIKILWICFGFWSSITQFYIQLGTRTFMVAQGTKLAISCRWTFVLDIVHWLSQVPSKSIHPNRLCIRNPKNFGEDFADLGNCGYIWYTFSLMNWLKTMIMILLNDLILILKFLFLLKNDLES